MRRLALTTATAVLVLATGCGGDEPTAAPTAPASSSAASTASSDPSGSGSESPTEEATSATTGTSIAPATGRLITGKAVTFHAPASFDGRAEKYDDGIELLGDIGYSLSFQDEETIVEEPLEAFAKRTIKGCCYDPKLQRQPDLTIAGQPAFHLAGPDPGLAGYADFFGFFVAGRTVTLAINTALDLPQPERDTLVGSVLASVALTG